MKVKGYDINAVSFLNIFFGALEKIFSYRYLNVWKTVYINFRSLPFKHAIRFPIVVWGRLRILSLMGKIVINAPFKTGMIRFGVATRKEFVGYSPSVFSNLGIIVFSGEAEIYNGFKIRVLRDAALHIGQCVTISSDVSILALDDITIGDYTRIAFNTFIMSSDLHYSINTNTRTIRSHKKPIVIGKNNWILSNVKIMKGTVTPDWTTVVAGSLLNKDYTKAVKENSIIGGSPAKLIREGQRRVFSLKNESFLNDCFKNSGEDKYVLGNEINIDNFCKR